jgi:capsular exopolysaccharide synthesis family protein
MEESPSSGRGQLPIPIGVARNTAMVPSDAVTPGTLLAELRRAETRDEDEIDLLGYWRVLVKRRWIVIGALALVAAAALVLTLLATPIFRSSATLQIERDSIKVVDVEGLMPMESSWDNDFYQTQYELLQSRTLAERVASQMGLATNALVERWSKPTPLQGLLAALRPADEAAAADAGPPEDRDFAGVVMGGLSVEPVRNSRLVRIHFDSPDREFSQRAINTVAEGFIAMNLERRFDASSYAKSYLEDRLAQLKQKLEDSERELVEFAQKEQILSGDDNQSLASQNLSELNSAVSQAQSARIRAESRWLQAQAAVGAALPSDMLNGSIIGKLLERRAEFQGQYQDKLRVFKPEYPEMKQLRGQIDEIDRQVAAEIATIKGRIKAEFDAAQTQEGLLRDQLKTLKTETLDLQNRSIDYNILQREVATNRELYDGLLQRYKEIGVAGGVSSNNISVVDRGELPIGRHKPSLKLNLAIGLLLGAMLGVLLALLLEYLDDTVKTPEDIEKKLHLVQLGIIPRLDKGILPDAALKDLRSGFAEAYRSVRTALQFSTERGVPQVLAVTSTQPGEGKTTTAKSLARNFAQLGKRVLLVDADLRNPALHRAFATENNTGLSNCLSGAAKAGQCIQRLEPNISVITSGPLPPNPAELLASARMTSLLTQARERFDQIIIDAPPVLGLADAPILANLAEGTLLVVESGKSRVGAVQVSIKRLLAARAHLIGAVLTKFDAKAAGYGYGYGGYGYNSYQYYSYGAEAPKRLGKR